MKELFLTAAKGAVIGGTMLIPGVSGGSMAMMMGIYDKLIMAVSNFRKDMKKHFFFLLWFCIGAGLGMLIIARPLLHLLEVFPYPTQFFFIGAVVGCVPMIYRKAQISWVFLAYPRLYRDRHRCGLSGQPGLCRAARRRGTERTAALSGGRRHSGRSGAGPAGHQCFLPAADVQSV